MYKVVLKNGVSFWDEKTQTNLDNSKKERVFDDEFIENHDMSEIELAIAVNTLSKVEMDSPSDEGDEIEEEVVVEGDQDEKESQVTEDGIEEEVIDETEEDKEESVEDNKEIPKEEEETDTLVELTEDGEPRCQKVKKDGSQCEYVAKYPEDEPQFCGLHKED